MHKRVTTEGDMEKEGIVNENELEFPKTNQTVSNPVDEEKILEINRREGSARGEKKMREEVQKIVQKRSDLWAQDTSLEGAFQLQFSFLFPI